VSFAERDRAQRQPTLRVPTRRPNHRKSRALRANQQRRLLCRLDLDLELLVVLLGVRRVVSAAVTIRADADNPRWVVGSAVRYAPSVVRFEERAAVTGDEGSRAAAALARPIRSC